MNLDFMKPLREVTDFFIKRNNNNPNNNAPDDVRRKEMNNIMSNDELIATLKNLKKEGISYRYIAKECNIKESTFYNYIYKNSFPFNLREQISNYINNKFSEVLKSYV